MNMPETDKSFKYIFAQKKRSVKFNKNYQIGEKVRHFFFFYLNGKTTQLDNKRVVNVILFAQSGH